MGISYVSGGFSNSTANKRQRYFLEYLEMCKTISCALLALILFSSVASATDITDDSPKLQAERHAKADGAAIALAVYCSVPNKSIKEYARALKHESRQYSIRNNLDFSSDAYEELMLNGYIQTAKFTKMLTPTPRDRRDNCAEVEKKIANVLSRNPTTESSPKSAE